jgi:hypothetical protein
MTMLEAQKGRITAYDAASAAARNLSCHSRDRGKWVSRRKAARPSPGEEKLDQLEDRAERRERTPSRPRLDDIRREWVARSLNEGAVLPSFQNLKWGGTSRKHSK